MIPPIANAQSVETTFLSWDKPLSGEERLMIDVILGRYSDAGMPLVTFETDSTFNMRVPKIWRRNFSEIE